MTKKLYDEHNISKDVILALRTRLAEIGDISGSQTTNPEDIRRALDSRDWAQLVVLFKKDPRIIRPYVSLSEEDIAQQNALHTEITQLIEQSEVTQDLCDFIGYYYSRTYLAKDDIDVIASPRFDSGSFKIPDRPVFVKCGVGIDEYVEFMDKLSQTQSRYGMKLLEDMILHYPGHHGIASSPEEVRELMKAFNSVISCNSDYLTYEFLFQCTRKICINNLVTQEQFNALLEQGMNATAAYALKNGLYTPREGDYQVAIRHIDQVNGAGFTSPGSDDTSTNIVFRMLSKSRDKEQWKQSILMLLDYTIEHPDSIRSVDALAELIEHAPLSIFRSPEFGKQISIKANGLHNDHLSALLIRRDISSSDADDLRIHCEHGDLESVLEMTHKGMQLTPNEFEAILSDERPLASEIITSQLQLGYIPSDRSQVEKLKDKQVGELLTTLAENGIDIVGTIPVSPSIDNNSGSTFQR